MIMDFLDKPTERFDVQQSASPSSLATGQVIRFEYDGKTKNALVLTGNWNGKLHALSLSSLSEASLESLLKELGNGTFDAISLRGKFESSAYAEAKPYRTYSPEKVSQIKVIKMAPKKKKSSKPKKKKQ